MARSPSCNLTYGCCVCAMATHRETLLKVTPPPSYKGSSCGALSDAFNEHSVVVNYVFCGTEVFVLMV